MLACGDGSLYSGMTNDVARRLKEHQAGRGGRYTRAHLPVRLAAVWAYPSRSRAAAAEAALKRLRRKAKLRLVHRRLPFQGADFAERILTRIQSEPDVTEL